MNKKPGYAALLTVIILAAAVSSIIFSVNSSSRVTSDISMNTENNYEATNAIESCVEDVLIRLNLNGTLPTSVVLPKYTCTVTTISAVNDVFTFRVSTTVDKSSKKVEIIAERDDSVYISKWEEIY